MQPPDRRQDAVTAPDPTNDERNTMNALATIKSRLPDWAKDAEAKGLPNAAKVLAEFRAEIAKNQ